MHYTLDYILGKPEDFKICVNCRALNWYANESCHACGSDEFKNDERDVEKLSEEIWEIYEEFCDNPGNVEIDTR